jgi:glutaredoxin
MSPIEQDENRTPLVVLYTRDGCHLCDDAEQVLLEHGLIPTLVDIDADETLKSCFDTEVPVVEIDGQVRFRGRVDPMLLRRLLANFYRS